MKQLRGFSYSKNMANFEVSQKKQPVFREQISPIFLRHDSYLLEVNLQKMFVQKNLKRSVMEVFSKDYDGVVVVAH